MNDLFWASAVASVLVVAAGIIGWRTWRAAQSEVMWMLPVDSWVAHAIPKTDLRAGPTDVEALARCGRWPVAALVGDADAERCVPCVRKVERLKRRRR